jgi:hypothetical protein
MAIAAAKNKSLENESYMGTFMKDSNRNKFLKTSASQIVRGSGETSMSFKNEVDLFSTIYGTRTA